MSKSGQPTCLTLLRTLLLEYNDDQIWQTVEIKGGIEHPAEGCSQGHRGSDDERTDIVARNQGRTDDNENGREMIINNGGLRVFATLIVQHQQNEMYSY